MFELSVSPCRLQCCDVQCFDCVALPLRDVSTVVSHFTCQVCSTGWVRLARLAGPGQERCHEASSWLDWGRPCTGLSARPSEPHVEPPATCSRHILYWETTLAAANLPSVAPLSCNMLLSECAGGTSWGENVDDVHDDDVIIIKWWTCTFYGNVRHVLNLSKHSL